jgi:very-short-patch-repair endonuclease
VYVRARTKITIICPVHGEFQQTPSQHLRGAGCFKCGRDKCTTNISDVISRFQKVHGERYDYSNISYKNSLHKVNITCHKHGDFQQTISSHSSGKGCPKCSSSKGENAIRMFFNQNNLLYIEQHPICRNPETNRKLRVDFYLPVINAVIEYDGKQHFKPVAFFGGQTGFENVIRRDNIKNEFCQKESIPMLRISYKDFKKIRDILQKFLTQSVDSTCLF